MKSCALSSRTGFPIKDVWQAEFYDAIGKYVPRKFVFCKEYAVQSGSKSGSVDFVLRNGNTRAIEFLIKSNDVIGHHRRFEKGAYVKMRNETHLIATLTMTKKVNILIG